MESSEPCAARRPLLSLSVAAGEMRAAEGYLLELLAWCAFADRSIIEVAGDNEGPAQS